MNYLLMLLAVMANVFASVTKFSFLLLFWVLVLFAVFMKPPKLPLVKEAKC